LGFYQQLLVVRDGLVDEALEEGRGGEELRAAHFEHGDVLGVVEDGLQMLLGDLYRDAQNGRVVEHLEADVEGRGRGGWSGVDGDDVPAVVYDGRGDVPRGESKVAPARLPGVHLGRGDDRADAIVDVGGAGGRD